ncbi:MAG: hypothetical protein HOC83_11405, partial [Polaribacter sp.]|nr:hypothetical protein [Polaribacter sp.]
MKKITFLKTVILFLFIIITQSTFGQINCSQYNDWTSYSASHTFQKGFRVHYNGDIWQARYTTTSPLSDQYVRDYRSCSSWGTQWCYVSSCNACSSNANNTTSSGAIRESQTKNLAGSPSGGTWNIVYGSGSISGSKYTPANITVNTNVKIRYTIAAHGSCVATTSDRTFTVTPVADNTTSSATIRETQTKTLTATPSGGAWSIVSGGGSINGSTYTPANITANTGVKIRYTYAGTTSDRTFTVTPVADNTTATNSITELQTKTLTATPSGGAWSIVSGGGSISGSTYTPANITANTGVK